MQYPTDYQGVKDFYGIEPYSLGGSSRTLRNFGIGSNLGTNLAQNRSIDDDDVLKNALLQLGADAAKNAQWLDRDDNKGILSTLYENFTGGGSPSAADAAKSGFDLSGFGSEGNYLAPAVGALGLFDVLSDKQNANTGGTIQGALSGASAGSYFGVPGTIIGSIIGGLSPHINKLFQGSSKTNEEQKRQKKLFDAGIMSGIYNEDQIDQLNTQNYSGFGANARGFVTLPDGTRVRVNNAFNSTRDEANLQGWDLVDRAAPYELFGADFGKLSQKKQAEILQSAIDRKLVREHHGTIDINADDVLRNAFSTAYQEYLAEQEKNKKK